MSQSARQQLLLVGISALVFFVNLGAARLWDIDEAIFAQTAVEMLDRHDFVVPYFNGQLFPDKPALTYWLMIGAYKAFGVNEFAARFWSAMFGIGSVLLTYQLGRRLFSPRVGFWAGLILATNLNFGIIARAATPDSLLTFFSALALYILVRAATRGTQEAAAAQQLSGKELTEPSWGNYALAYAAMGAAVMVKGPIGVVLPTAVWGLFLLCTRGPNALASLPAQAPGAGRWGWLSRTLDGVVRTFSPLHFLRTVYRMRPFTALAMMLLVAGPWYVWVGLRTHGDWPSQFFGTQNFGRFLTAMDNHRGPMVYYLGVILVLFFPWSIVMAGSVGQLLKSSARASGYRAGAILVLCWLVVYIGFFSLASTKLPNYIIPAYPALALMTALFLERWLTAPESFPRWWLGVAFSILGLAGLAIGVGAPAAAALLAEPNWALGLAGFAPLVGAIVGLVLVARRQLPAAAISLGVTATALVLWWFGVSVVQADRFQTTQKFVATIEAHTSGEPHVASLLYFRPSMVFYGHHPVDKLKGPEQVGEFFRAHGSDAFVYTLEEHLTAVRPLLPPGVTVLEDRRWLFKRGKIVLLGRPTDVERWSPMAPEAQHVGRHLEPGAAR